MREVCCLGGHLLKKIRRQCHPQGRSKGFPLARKRLKMVKHDGVSPFLAYARAQLLCRMSLLSLPSSLLYQQQSLLFGASFSALLPHSLFTSPQTTKAAVWSGVLLNFFRRQNSGWPYLPRSCRELGNQSSSSSSMRAKILLTWIISFRIQAQNIKPNTMEFLSQPWMLI